MAAAGFRLHAQRAPRAARRALRRRISSPRSTTSAARSSLASKSCSIRSSRRARPRSPLPKRQLATSTCNSPPSTPARTCCTTQSGSTPQACASSSRRQRSFVEQLRGQRLVAVHGSGSDAGARVERHFARHGLVQLARARRRWPAAAPRRGSGTGRRRSGPGCRAP